MRWYRAQAGAVCEIIDFDPAGIYSADLMWIGTDDPSLAIGLAVDAAGHFIPPLAVRKARRLDDLADRRWQAEVGGTMIGGVVPLKTDTTTQTKLTASYLKASQGPEFSISNWKHAAGVFGPLTNAEIIAAGDALTTHIQACFDKEATLTASILAAADHAALDAIDIDTGWPN